LLGGGGKRVWEIVVRLFSCIQIGHALLVVYQVLLYVGAKLILAFYNRIKCRGDCTYFLNSGHLILECFVLFLFNIHNLIHHLQMFLVHLHNMFRIFTSRNLKTVLEALVGGKIIEIGTFSVHPYRSNPHEMGTSGHTSSWPLSSFLTNFSSQSGQETAPSGQSRCKCSYISM